MNSSSTRTTLTTRKQRHAMSLGVIYTVLILASIVMLTPFAYLISASLKSSDDFFSGLFLPRGDGLFGIAWAKLTLEHFYRLFTELNFARFVINSFFLASVTSLAATFCAAAGGYALAKFKFRGRELFTNIVLASLVIPGALLIAPAYQLLFWLGLLDSYAGLIIPGIAPAFGIYLFRQASIAGIPDEILESARMDGCGELRMFFTMALPLVRPMIGAFLLITFLGSWNNFIGPQIVLQTPEKMPLAVAIAQLKGVYNTDFGLLMAGTLVSIAPVLALFLLLQKEFIAGLTSGAVKG
jgi:ABC-type glycerol-3-phosphate transport system permease component